tara:strand:- start:702600 stop:704402 length:1803 start_codon:yes stop_codon:yes gene_type:complete
MDLIPVMERGGAGMEMRLTLSESAKAMAQIETASVGRFFPSAETRLFGKLVYDETSVARISAYFPGRIDRLFVNYIGVSVQQGDHLAELYSPDLIASFEELRQAKKSFDQAGDSSSFLRDTASQTLAASREKLRLFGLTQEQIAQVESGNYESDDLTIYAPIGGVVTHLAAREGDYLDTGDPIATVSNLSRLWLDLEVYESQLSMLRWGLPVTFTVEAHPGEVFEGRVSFIEPIVDERTRTAAVRVAVDNTDRRLKPGMFATAVVRAKIAADGAVISDELAGKWVSPMHPTVVKDSPGTCDVCGMDLVSAESLGIVGDSSQAVMPMVIPRTAVLFTGTRSVVYVQVPDQDEPTYEGRTIELGSRAGDYYTVRSGINEGDQVVVHGAFRIDSAMQILAKPSMMMPSGGASGSGHNHGGGVAAMPQMNMSSTVPDEFIESLHPVYTAYLDAQEQLANDDLGGFLDTAKALSTIVASVQVTGLFGEQLGAWKAAANKLRISSPITTMDEARSIFEQMSGAILDLQSRFGNPTGEMLYTAHCPMAFDFKGADWVQRGTEIKNPYYGSEMHRCGTIQEVHEPLVRQVDRSMDITPSMNHEEPEHD